MTEPRLVTLPARVVDARGVEYKADGIVEAIRRWADRHGEPPTVADWDPSRAHRTGQQWRAERFNADEWPTADIVRAAFRTFNAAVEAAGMTPQPTPRRAPPRVAMRPPGPGTRRRGSCPLPWNKPVRTSAGAGQRRLPTGSGRSQAPAEPVILTLLWAELVRLAGRVLAWADALPEQAR